MRGDHRIRAVALALVALLALDVLRAQSARAQKLEAEELELRVSLEDQQPAMEKQLADWFADQQARSLGATSLKLTPGTVKRLQELGYMRDGEGAAADGEDAATDEQDAETGGQDAETGGQDGARDPEHEKSWDQRKDQHEHGREDERKGGL